MYKEGGAVLNSFNETTLPWNQNHLNTLQKKENDGPIPLSSTNTKC